MRIFNFLRKFKSRKKTKVLCSCHYGLFHTSFWFTNFTMPTVVRAHEPFFLRQVRSGLLRQIDLFRPKELLRLSRHARQKLTVQIVRADAHKILQFEPTLLLPTEVGSILARLSVLYVESPTKLLPQLSEFSRALIHLASFRIASHIPALLLSLLVVSVGCKERDADARFNAVFSILKDTWPSYNASWHPADYVSIAHTVSVALHLRYPLDRIREVPQTLGDLFSTAGSVPLRSGPNLTSAAFAAATICSFDVIQSFHPVYSFLVRELTACHDIFSSMLRRNASIALGADHAIPTTLTMLLTTAGSHAIAALPSELRVTTVRSLETILLNMELYLTRRDQDEFNVGLHKVVSSRMERIGYIYATASMSSRMIASSVDFVSRLVTARNLVEPLTSFVTSFVTKCASDVSPRVAVSLANILTYVHKPSPITVLAVSSSIAKEIRGTTSLLGLLIATLFDAQKTGTPFVSRKIYDRASKLKRVATVTILTQQDNNNITQEGWLEDIDDSIFGLSIRVIVESVLKIDPGKNATSFVQSGLDLVSAFVRNNGVHIQQAREWVIVSGVPAIFEAFLGEQSQWRPTNTIVRIIAHLFDSVADGVSERELIKSCLNGIVPLAVGKDSEHFEEFENRESGRVVYILLLRFMVRCDLAVIDLAMDAIDLSLGSSNERKQRLLHPAQVAVMGSELGRKDICVEWLLRTFNDLGSHMSEDRVTDGKQKVNALATAKL